MPIARSSVGYALLGPIGAGSLEQPPMGSPHKLHPRDSHQLCILDSPAMPSKLDGF